jgi:chromosome partitioning protein
MEAYRIGKIEAMAGSPNYAIRAIPAMGYSARKKGRSMRGVIACANLKGGVGKSTVSVNFAACLATRNIDAVLFDADRQGTSGSWARHGRLPVEVISHPWEPSGRGATWKKPIQLAGMEKIALVDCPPSLEGATEAAIELAKLVLIPVTASGADLHASARALQLVRSARRSAKGPPMVLLVPNRVDRRTAAGRELTAALRHMGEPIGPTIGARTKFVDAFTAGEWIGDFAPNSPAAQDIEKFTSKVLEVLNAL